jgi:hypothetical protein
VTRSIVVTGCDANHFDLATDLLTSLRDQRGRDITVGFIHVGDDPLPAAIAEMADQVVNVPDSDDLAAKRGYPLARLVIKPRIPEFFPDFDTYVWLDGDTWVQNATGIDHLVHCATLSDVCMHPEADPDYFHRQVPDPHTVNVYLSLFGREEMERHVHFTMLNAGVFSAQASSPLWQKWKEALAMLRDQAAEPRPYFSDQIPLHRLVSRGELRVHPLRAVNNWLAYHASPAFNLERKLLLTPTFPHQEINIIHLVAQSKDRRFRLGTDGGEITLRYRDVRQLFYGGAD